MSPEEKSLIRLAVVLTASIIAKYFIVKSITRRMEETYWKEDVIDV